MEAAPPNFHFHDLQPAPEDFHTDVIAGLSRQTKRLSPKFFYDELGSQLFDAITRLPAATGWVDFWTGQRQKGGETVRAEAPLSRIPIHVKEGSILVLGPPVQSAEDTPDPLEVRIYPGSNADFTFYEDQGDGYAYESGQRATIPMHWDDLHHLLVIGPTNGSFPNMPKQQTLRIVSVHAGHGVGVLPDKNADRVVQYDGHRIAVDVPDSRKNPSSAALAR